MGFQLGNIANETDVGKLKGIQREIACECWFTSKGKTTPRIIKIMDEEGMLHTIKEIQVLSSEEKSFSGIPTIEHICKIRIGNVEDTVKLVYTKESCRWVIVKV